MVGNHQTSINWLVLSDEQMRNWLGVEHWPVKKMVGLGVPGNQDPVLHPPDRGDMPKWRFYKALVPRGQGHPPRNFEVRCSLLVGFFLGDGKNLRRDG